MTDQELAQLLITVAQKLETQAENISGKAFAEHAAKLQTAVLKLEKLLESTSLTDSPEAQTLSRDLLEAEGSCLLEVKTLKKITKDILGKTFTPKKTESRYQTFQRLVQITAEAGMTSEMSARVRMVIESTKRPRIEQFDTMALAGELNKLGVKNEDELTSLLMEYYTDEEVRALGRASSPKVTPKSTKKKLVPDIVRFARRLSENTSWQP